MGIYDNWTYTDLHQLNLDWVIKTVAKLQGSIDSVISDAQTIVDNASGYADSAAESAKTAGDAADLAEGYSDDSQQSANNAAQYLSSIIQMYNTMLALTGSPLVASQASDMTDTNKIYVYVGSEVGYTYGHWYYFNGSVWTDGGAYNSSALNTNKTLTIADQAADAKATGDKIDALSSKILTERSIDVVSTIPHPTGYESGYISGSIGSTWTNSNSVYYIHARVRFSESNYPQLKGAKFIKYTPAPGYSARITEFDPDTDIITNLWGQINTNTYPEYMGYPIVAPYNPERNYFVSVGRFNNSDAATYADDQSFIDTLDLSIVYLYGNGKTNLPKTGKSEYFEINSRGSNVEAVLMLPDNYAVNGTPVRLVMACHGESGYIDSANDIWYNSSWISFMDDLLAAGYAVFDCNIFPTSTGTSVMGADYGSPIQVYNLKQCYDYITDNYNVYPQIFVHGSSMGGCAATAFTNTYPELVLAESGFAGRDIVRYVKVIKDGTDTTEMDKIAVAYGYNDSGDLIADKWSMIAGMFPSLSLAEINNGSITLVPDRSDDFSNWLTYVCQIAELSRNASFTPRMGTKRVPYKAWNSWADNVNRTKTQQVLRQAYNQISATPYDLVEYESATHSQLTYGSVNDMRNELIDWFKRWE